jgi:hypothetical protein
MTSPPNNNPDFQSIFIPEVLNHEPKSPEEALDIPTVHVSVDINFEPIENKGDEENFNHDIQYVRTKLLNAIGQADHVLTSLIKLITIDEQLVSMDQPPKGFYRYYDVSTQLLKSISESSKELINLHSNNVKIKKEMEWNTKKEDIDAQKEDGEKVQEIVNKTSTLKDLVSKVKIIQEEQKEDDPNTD